MPRHDVLRVATVFGAEAIGLSKGMGFVGRWKARRPSVLDANPLDDIKYTNTVQCAMKNGRLYDGNTLSEVSLRQRDVAKRWCWSRDPVSGAQQDR